MKTPAWLRVRSWAGWLRVSSLLAIVGCRYWGHPSDDTDTSGTVDTTPESEDSSDADSSPNDTSENDSSEDSDSETSGPCGPGRPAECVEVRDGVCLFSEIPSYLAQDPLPAGGYETALSSAPPDDPEGVADNYCGLATYFRCGEFVTSMPIDGVGGLDASGFPAVGEPGYFGADVYHATTRHQAAVGIVAGPPGGPGCPVAWYGDAEALPCLFHGLDIARANYGSCILNTGDPCPFCSCRINEINPAEVCAQPSPAE